METLSLCISDGAYPRYWQKQTRVGVGVVPESLGMDSQTNPLDEHDRLTKNDD